MKVQIEINEINLKITDSIFDPSFYPGPGFYRVEQPGIISLMIFGRDNILWSVGNYNEIPLSMLSTEHLIAEESEYIPNVTEEFALKMLAVALKPPTLKL